MKYKIVARKRCYNGFFHLDLVTLRHELFRGGWSGLIKRELFERGNAVAVLVHDPARDLLLLLEQFRIGAIHDSHGPWLLEIVAGIVEPGEKLEDVARREATEEAGCELGTLQHIMDFYPSPGGSTESISLFYAPLDLASMAAGVHGLADEDEDIKVSIVPRVQAMEWLQQGRIKAAPAVIALQWLALQLS